MGSAASPFFAEYFMSKFESKLFNLNRDLLKYVFCWYRYVDDIFCIWTGTTRQLGIFVNEILNKLDNSIKFTVEIGIDKINFLDVTISINKSKLDFQIYRKETFTDAVIPFHSDHPWNVKLAAFHSMIDRLLRIPLSQLNFKKELKTIVKIAKNNGYKKKLVYNLLNKKQYVMNLNLIFPKNNLNKEQKCWKKIPYMKGVSENIKNVLKKCDVEPAFFNRNNLKALLSNSKINPKTDKLEKSGVYQINCGDCSGIYIGKTKRKLKTRFKEHIAGARNGKLHSGLSKHLFETGHKTDLDKMKLIRNLDGGIILDKFETYEIKKAKLSNKYILNDQIDYSKKSPLLDLVVHEREHT